MELQFDYVCISVSSICNLECEFCYRVASKNEFIKEQDFESLLSKLKQMGYKKINLTGGEPLLHPFINDFIKMAYAYGFFIILSTNGMLLDLREPIYKLVNVIDIPLDGSTSAINSHIRGEDQFKQINTILSDYQNHNFPFVLKVNTVMTMYNYDDMINLARVLCNKKIYWRVFFCRKYGKYNFIQDKNLISPEMYLEKINEIDKRFPDLLLLDACKRDVDDNLTYTMINSDGDFIISQGWIHEKVGNLFSLSAKELMTIIEAKHYTIVEHRGKNYENKHEI